MHAAKYAVRLFGPDAFYTLLHTYIDASAGDVLQPSILPELMQAGDEGLQDLAKRFMQESGAKHVRRELRYGTVTSAVKDMKGIDHVVMGRRGMGGATLFGSNTTEVAKSSRCPVLIVPEGAALHMPRRIMLAMDDGETDAEDLKPLRLLAMEHAIEVRVVRVLHRIPAGEVPPSRGIIDRALVGVPHSFRDGLSDDPVEGVLRAAGHDEADMICVLHRHVGMLDAIFHTSTTKRIVNVSELPVLVLQHGS